MAVFRVEKTKDFTVMCNHHLRNVKLSLKARENQPAGNREAGKRYGRENCKRYSRKSKDYQERNQTASERQVSI